MEVRDLEMGARARNVFTFAGCHCVIFCMRASSFNLAAISWRNAGGVGESEFCICSSFTRDVPGWLNCTTNCETRNSDSEQRMTCVSEAKRCQFPIVFFEKKKKCLMYHCEEHCFNISTN